jgi:hypothetical protein
VPSGAGSGVYRGACSSAAARSGVWRSVAARSGVWRSVAARLGVWRSVAKTSDGWGSGAEWGIREMGGGSVEAVLCGLGGGSGSGAASWPIGGSKAAPRCWSSWSRSFRCCCSPPRRYPTV